MNGAVDGIAKFLALKGKELASEFGRYKGEL